MKSQGAIPSPCCISSYVQKAEAARVQGGQQSWDSLHYAFVKMEEMIRKEEEATNQLNPQERHVLVTEVR
jgi:predicted sugar kinase